MKVVKLLGIIFMLSIIGLPIVSAVDLSREPSSDEKQTFEQILVPIMKIYRLVAYIATGIAAIFGVLAGISLMMSGSDPKKKDQAKHMLAYIVLGLVVIWAVPFLITYLL